ncbi:MAG: hypothetical protein WC058_13325 [Phycisphaeraceae bacterium]
MRKRTNMLRSIALPVALMGLAVMMPVGLDDHAALARQVVDQAVEQAQSISQQVRASARTFVGRSPMPQQTMFAAHACYESPLIASGEQVGMTCVDVSPLPGYRTSAGVHLIDLPPPV